MKKADKVEFTYKIHPDYNDETIKNDIAIITLKKAIKINTYVLLDDKKIGKMFKYPVNAFGWGKTDIKKQTFTQDILRKADLILRWKQERLAVISMFFLRGPA